MFSSNTNPTHKEKESIECSEVRVSDYHTLWFSGSYSGIGREKLDWIQIEWD